MLTRPSTAALRLSAGKLLGRSNGSAGSGQEISLGSGLSLTGTVLAATASGGGGTGTFSQPAAVPATLAAGAGVVVTHPALTNERYLVQAMKLGSALGLTTVVQDFLTGDSSKFTVDSGAVSFSGDLMLQNAGGSPALLTLTGVTQTSSTAASATAGSRTLTMTATVPEYDYRYPVRYMLDGTRTTPNIYLGSSGGGDSQVTVTFSENVYLQKLNFGTGQWNSFGRMSDIVNIETTTDGTTWTGFSPPTTISPTQAAADASQDFTVGRIVKSFRFTLSSSGAAYTTGSAKSIEMHACPAVFAATGWSVVTTNDSGQITLANMAVINSATVAQTVPVNTAIKYAVSFDGRVTWKAWNGSAWVTIADVTTDGCTAAQLQAGFTALTPPGSTLDFRIAMQTTDAGNTPSVQSISLNYDESARYDLCSIGGPTSSADVRVTRLTSTTTRFVNNTGATGDFIINMVTP